MIWALVVVAVVATAVLAADWAVRTYEMSQLVNRIEASESVMVQTQEQMAALRLPDDPTEAQRDQAAKVLQSIAGAGHEAVAAAGGDVAHQSFLPWHSSLLEAQRGYLAHNQAWVDYLERGSEDVTVLLSDDSAIEATWTRAEDQVRGAMPWPAWAPLADRVERIFLDGDAPADDSPDGPDGLDT